MISLFVIIYMYLHGNTIFDMLQRTEKMTQKYMSISSIYIQHINIQKHIEKSWKAYHVKKNIETSTKLQHKKHTSNKYE